MSQQMTVSFPGGKQVAAHYDGFDILTDQSVDSGGDAAAPEPYDLFLASLATCAGYYVLAFCAKRGLAHDGIRLTQRWERQDGRLSAIHLDIEVPGGFPGKYHAALVRAANQCSVKKTLDGPPELTVSTVVRGVES
jgi:ribosomal protein S12 methylthiotransferase accessory factor